MPQLINWDMISHPYNWVIVILMLAIGVAALTILQPAIDRIGANMVLPGQVGQ